jgi:hypothetical protein
VVVIGCIGDDGMLVVVVGGDGSHRVDFPTLEEVGLACGMLGWAARRVEGDWLGYRASIDNHPVLGSAVPGRR